MKISLNWLKRYVDVPCSAQELGHKLTMVGFPVPSVEAVGDDFVLDVEVTSNRPDLLSHLGMAREVAGLVGARVREPSTQVDWANEDVSVEIAAPDLCPSYIAYLIRGVTVGPSPRGLAKLLEAVGQRPVNNVVDITNFIMLECGQPLHAFDFAKLRGQKIVVRRAAGESMTAIDGKQIVVGPDDLAICDGVGPVALAGVMGSKDSEVTNSTTDILLESAKFAPHAVRASARRHQLHSESSYQFERRVPYLSFWTAPARAAALMVEHCSAKTISCAAGPAGVGALRYERVELRTSRVERVFGARVSEDEVRSVLTSLGFEESGPRRSVDVLPGTTVWDVPTWRWGDVTAEIDLIEEVARRVGFDRVPSDVRIPVRPAVRDDRRRALRRLRDALVAAGLRECCTAPFVGEGPNDIALVRDVPALRVDNPMRAEESLLRRSLLGPLLVVARGNKDRGVPAVRLFEIAPVYLRGDTPKSDEEALLASGVVTGDYFAAKGCVESALAALGIEGATFDRGAPAPLRRDRSATVKLGGDVVGFVGELGPRALAKYGLEAATALFELRADRLAALASMESRYRPVPRHPAIERDLAWIVDESVSWQSIESTARGAAGEMLASIRPFDVFRGAQAGDGKKSVALRMELRAHERTLTTAEADACVARVVEALAKSTSGRLRA